jgi:beta-mannosidase
MAPVASAVNLDGPWLMKDFPQGGGVANEAYLPGHRPKDALPIEVPGTVREALREAGMIPDPYVGYDNEQSLWTEEREWWFYRTFPVASEFLGRHIDLVFEGTTFRGEVWVNGHSAGALEGMLNARALDVSRLLAYGKDNTLAVRLEATPDARRREVTRGLTWPSPRDQLYSVAQCMYGWDWGPHGVPVGIWRPVALRLSGALRVEHPYIRTDILSTTKARCGVDLDVRNLSSGPSEGKLHGEVLEKDSKRPVAEFERSIQLAPGESRTLHMDLDVQNPKLWWPNGMGEHPLYLLEASVSDATGESEELTTQFGIREIKLVENEKIDEFLKAMKGQLGDSHHLGNVVGSYPWTFQVNGKKMFAKGGNWIPADQLLRLDRDRYERLLGLARDSHFNLLRVWGGGLYETEDFYELCDEYGILAWQEFLSNRSFSKIDRENFLEGAESAVLRLRNHPSLTFWCGGNEFDPDDGGSKAVIDSLAALLEKRDPQREFHRASPYMGDDHHWGVWHHKQPYTDYRVLRPFRSEAGINAPPVFEDYVKFTPEAQRWPLDATYVEYRGESNTRFTHLDKLLRYANEFGAPTSLEDFIRKSQLYQALGNEFDMEYCRSNKFRNSGFLVWQFDDIWPAISWATVDWYGTPKPAYYYQARASRPVHISADFERYLWKPTETFAANVYLLNDTEAAVTGAAFVARLLDVDGRILAERKGPAHGDANQSVKIGTIEYPIPDGLSGRAFFVSVELEDQEGRAISDALYPIAVNRAKGYDGIFAELQHMPSVALKAELAKDAPTPDGAIATATLRLTNPSSKLVFFVRLRMLEESAILRTSYSDNYVSLLPGESKAITIRVDGKESISDKVHFEVSGWNSPAQVLEGSLRER